MGENYMPKKGKKKAEEKVEEKKSEEKQNNMLPINSFTNQLTIIPPTLFFCTTRFSISNV
jgi:hypothetical protein